MGLITSNMAKGDQDKIAHLVADLYDIIVRHVPGSAGEDAALAEFWQQPVDQITRENAEAILRKQGIVTDYTHTDIVENRINALIAGGLLAGVFDPDGGNYQLPEQKLRIILGPEIEVVAHQLTVTSPNPPGKFWSKEDSERPWAKRHPPNCRPRLM